MLRLQLKDQITEMFFTGQVMEGEIAVGKIIIKLALIQLAFQRCVEISRENGAFKGLFRFFTGFCRQAFMPTFPAHPALFLSVIGLRKKLKIVCCPCGFFQSVQRLFTDSLRYTLAPFGSRTCILCLNKPDLLSDRGSSGTTSASFDRRLIRIGAFILIVLKVIEAFVVRIVIFPVSGWVIRIILILVCPDIILDFHAVLIINRKVANQFIQSGLLFILLPLFFFRPMFIFLVFFHPSLVCFTHSLTPFMPIIRF